MTSSPDSGAERVAGDRNPQPRAGWDGAFREMAARGDDRPLDGDIPVSTWDDAEWEW